MSVSSPSWPKDLQKRSYLMGGLCGDGTDRACPSSDTPMIRNGCAYVSPDGRTVFPQGPKPTGFVPFDRGKPGPRLAVDGGARRNVALSTDADSRERNPGRRVRAAAELAALLVSPRR